MSFNESRCCCCCCLGYCESVKVESSLRSQFPLKGKKGAAFTLREDGQEDHLMRIKRLRPFWNYSWGVERVKQQPSDIQFVPMFWGYNKNRFHDNLREVKRQNSKILLGYNEPDNKNQSNVPVEIALKFWQNFEDLHIPLVSPSCAHPGGEWMTDFMMGVERRGLRVDAIGVHNYGGGNSEALKAELHELHRKFKRPLIVTEFAVADWTAKTAAENRHSPEKVLKFMTEVLPWMESTEWILGYAWFPFSMADPVGTSSALFEQDGTLTRLGEFYSNYEPSGFNCSYPTARCYMLRK